MALLFNEPMQLCAHKCLTSSRERGISSCPCSTQLLLCFCRLRGLVS